MLDKLPDFKKVHYKDFIEFRKRIDEKYNSDPGHINFGAVEPEREYDLPLEFSDAEAAFYVIARNFV